MHLKVIKFKNININTRIIDKDDPILESSKQLCKEYSIQSMYEQQKCRHVASCNNDDMETMCSKLKKKKTATIASHKMRINCCLLK